MNNGVDNGDGVDHESDVTPGGFTADLSSIITPVAPKTEPINIPRGPRTALGLFMGAMALGGVLTDTPLPPSLAAPIDCDLNRPPDKDGTHEIEGWQNCSFSITEIPGAVIDLKGIMTVNGNALGKIKLKDGRVIIRIVTDDIEADIVMEGNITLQAHGEKGGIVEDGYLTEEERKNLAVEHPEISPDQTIVFVNPLKHRGFVTKYDGEGKIIGQKDDPLSVGLGKNFPLGKVAPAMEGCGIAVAPGSSSPEKTPNGAWILLAGGLFLALRNVTITRVPKR